MSPESPILELRGSLRSLDRRRFLRAAGLLGMAWAWPLGCAHPLPPGAPLRVLSPRAYAVVNALAPRIVGGRAEAELRAGRVDPGRGVDDFLSSQPDVAEPLERALRVLEFGVYPLMTKVRPFTALAGPAQDRLLADLAGSPWRLKRLLFRALKSISLVSWYGSALYQPVSRHPRVAGVRIEDAMTYPAERPLP